MARLAVIVSVLLAAAGARAGDVTGEVTLALEGMRFAELGPTVVYLDRDAQAAEAGAHAGRVVIRQRNARFEPEFLVVSVGQPVEMPNDDAIFHNVFSFSRPNDFDLGIYPAGESRTVAFRHAGLVRIYCSIHESMSGAVLVAPTPWFAVASAAGRFRIADVPGGRYTLNVWNEKLPLESRPLHVVGGSDQSVDVALGRITH